MSMHLDVMLFHDLAHIIEQGKNQLVKQVNSSITLVYWQVGKKINEHILNNQRAEYAKENVSTVSTQLSWSHIVELLPTNISIELEQKLLLLMVKAKEVIDQRKALKQ